MIKENNLLREQLEQRIPTRDKTISTSNFLNALLDTAKSNENKKVNRFDSNSTLKSFASYLFVVGGRKFYEILHANLKKSLPSIATINRKISTLETIPEGSFRFSTLKDYLLKRGYPLAVWISEDGTRINGKTEYDVASNSIVGFTPPLDCNGLPVTNAFLATSADKIREIFDRETISSNAYCIMAQPLAYKAPPICLSLFGTDNRFDSTQVLSRWDWMVKEAEKEGINILGFSSDGDPKLLKSMRVKVFSDFIAHESTEGNARWSEWFYGKFNTNIFFVQDHIHIAAKLRTRVLKDSIVLPMGQYIASSTFLRLLIEKFDKNLHFLTFSDLDLKDKMNFRAMEKMCDEKVLTLMAKQFPDSKATVTYLLMAKLSVNAFIDESLTPEQRLENIWEAVLFFRYWLDWLKTEGYSTTKNFITQNAYICLELNAHAMIQIIRFCRDNNKSDLFLPFLFQSQTCESFFRQLRSMTTTQSTVVNFSMLDLLHRIKRVDMQADVILKLDKTYDFPRAQRTTAKTYEYAQNNHLCLPSDSSIEEIIEKARLKAVSTCNELKITISDSSMFPPLTLSLEVSQEQLTSSLEESENSDDECVEIPGENLTVPHLPNNISNKQKEFDYESSGDESSDSDSTCSTKLDPSSRWVSVINEKGQKIVMKKSRLCWALSSGHKSLSSDRTQRVKAEAPKKDKISSNKKSIITDNKTISVEEHIKIGDWCAFKWPDNYVMIGRVLSFSYLTGKGASRNYSSLSAPVKYVGKGKGKGIGCLCSWFTIRRKNKLAPCNMDYHGHHDINDYICTVDPILENNIYSLSQETVKYFKSYKK